MWAASRRLSRDSGDLECLSMLPAAPVLLVFDAAELLMVNSEDFVIVADVNEVLKWKQ